MMTDPAASRPGTHLDPDQMADLFEGLLDAAAADGARAHLASCPLCSADFALITGEAYLGDLADLGDLLPPTPIPQDVVARVEAALYREPPLGTPAASAPASAGSAVGRTAIAPQPRRRRFRIALGSLAGAALVVAGGIGVVTALNNASSSSKSSSTAAGNDAAPPNVDSSHAAGQAPGGESPQADGSTGSPGFSDMSVAQQAEALLSLHTVSPANGTAQAARPDCPPATVPAGTKLIASTQTVYQGKPAWLLLYPRAGSATAVDVYVVDVDMCTSGNPGQSVDHVVITRP